MTCSLESALPQKSDPYGHQSFVQLIDLLMDLFRGAVFDHGRVPENCLLASTGVPPP